MFEVLAFVYENYYTGDTRPEPLQLERKLSAVGFESDEVDNALTWLKDLDNAASATRPEPWLIQPHASSVRIFPNFELAHLGPQAVGFLRFLESASVLTAHMREVVIDRAMAAPGGPVQLDDLKLIILMVYQSFGMTPDALVLDELCEAPEDRIAH